MIYTILDISELNTIDYSDIPHHNPECVRTSINGLKFIVKYEVKPSFITDEVEYTHNEILTVVSGNDWSNNTGI